MLTEGGLVITDISHYPLLGTGEGPTLWGNKPLHWVGAFLSQSGKRPSGKGEEGKGNPHMLPTTATFRGTWILGTSTYTPTESWPVRTLTPGAPQSPLENPHLRCGAFIPQFETAVLSEQTSSDYILTSLCESPLDGVCLVKTFSYKKQGLRRQPLLCITETFWSQTKNKFASSGTQKRSDQRNQPNGQIQLTYYLA